MRRPTVGWERRHVRVRAAWPRPRRYPSCASPSASTSANESDDDQKQNCADRGVGDRGYDAVAEMNVELRQRPASDEGAGNADDEVAEDSKARALHDLAGDPSGDDADADDDEKTFS